MDYTEALLILKLNKDCSRSDIKTAYRKAARSCHPDLGGSEEQMKKINEAKSVLDDAFDTGILPITQSQSTYGARSQTYTATPGRTKQESRERSFYGSNTRGFNSNTGQNSTKTNQTGWNYNFYHQRGPFADDWEAFNKQSKTDVGSREACSKKTGSKFGTKQAITKQYNADVGRLNELLSNEVKEASSKQTTLKITKIVACFSMLVAMLVAMLSVYNSTDLYIAVKYTVMATCGVAAIFSLKKCINVIIDRNIKIGRIKLVIKNNASGTYIVVWKSGVKLGSFHISNMEIANRADEIMDAWRFAVIENIGAFTLDEYNNLFNIVSGEHRYCKFLEFNQNCIVIPVKAGEIIICPGVIIYSSNDRITVEPMVNTSVSFRASQENQKFNELVLTHSDNKQLKLYFPYGIDSWEELV